MFSVNLRPNEKLVGMYRQTEMKLVKSVFFVFLLTFVPFYFLARYELLVEYKRLAFFWSGLVFLYFVRAYLLWLLNVCVLTSSRVIKITYEGLFSKNVSETPLNRVSNISFTSKGIIANLFNIGNVKIEIFGSQQILQMPHVRNPAEVKDTVWEVHKKALESSPDIFTNQQNQPPDAEDID